MTTPDQLEIIEVIQRGLTGPQTDELFEQLKAVHSRHFGAYGHVMDEVAQGLDLPGTVRHAWLLRIDGRPVGEFLFHTCLGRHIVQIQYVAMDPDARSLLPLGWLAEVTDAALRTSMADAAPGNVDLWAMAGEMFSTPADYRRWRRKGFLILALDYREPVGGRRASEPLSFNPMTLGVRLTEAGRQADPQEVLDEVLASFLLDYYGLPRDHPEVVRVFTEAREVGLAELSDDIINARTG